MAAYNDFVSILGAANAGKENSKCDKAAKELYLLAGQYAAQMMTQGYDGSPPPADRPQKLQIANEMYARAEMACWTQPTPEPGPTPGPTPTPGPQPSPVAQAGLSWWWVAGAAALAVYFWVRK